MGVSHSLRKGGWNVPLILSLPLDGSEFAEHAVAAASAIARRDGARINVVHVHEPLFGELDEELQAQERDYLETMAGRISEATGGEVTYRNLVGRINEQLQAYAQQSARISS